MVVEYSLLGKKCVVQPRPRHHLQWFRAAVSDDGHYVHVHGACRHLHAISSSDGQLLGDVRVPECHWDSFDLHTLRREHCQAREHPGLPRHHTDHHTVPYIRKLLRERSGLSTKDVLFSRLFTAASALVALTPDEVSDFLDRVDEPDRHAIKEALIIIETEVIGVPHPRLTLAPPMLEPSRVESIVAEAVKGKDYSISLNGRESRVSLSTLHKGRATATDGEASITTGSLPVGSRQLPASPTEQTPSKELGRVTQKKPPFKWDL
eukprot:1256693-Amphidinium_carterae.1